MLDPAFHFRLHHSGVLLSDAIAYPPLGFVIDPTTAEIVFPADGAIMAADELVLFVPQEELDNRRELQLLLTGHAIEIGSVTDRWMAYHGSPRWGGFMACRIHGARFDGRALEEAEIETLNRPVGIGRLEAVLLRRLNGDRARLRAACRKFAQALIPEPFAVGVDKCGVDVRATFGIVRLDWGDSPDPAKSVEHLLEPD